MGKIGEFILNNSSLIVPVLVVTVILFFGILEKRRKLSPISLIFTMLAVISYVLATFVLKDLVFFNLNFIVHVAILVVFVLVLNLILYLFANAGFYQRLNLIRNASSSTGNKVFAYFNHNAKLLNFTDEFAALLEVEDTKKKQYNDVISAILVDSQEMSLDVFLHYIRSLDERDYRMVIYLVSDKKIKIDMFKRKIIVNGKLLGFVLMTYGGISTFDGSAFDARTFYNYINFLGEAICYFEYTTRRYILTGEMMNLLGVSDNQLGENAFLAAVVKEDLSLVANRNLNDKLQKNYYRINTSQGRIWFEESNINYEGHYYVVIHKTDFARLKMNFYDHTKLLETTGLIYDRNNWVSLILINFLNLPTILQEVGKDVIEVILTKFFSQSSTELGLKNMKVYRVDDYVYAILIDKKENYNRLLEALNNGKTSLMKTAIIFNERKYEISNTLGIVSSENVENSQPETILNSALEALNLATDEKYQESYCIYISKPTQNVDFNELGIDLSDEFLDDILK
ncbi:MAG: hypothetical protein PHX62_02475 [Bacilli bacterium]|nr:hypothetical protein [Bacilli bacterium]